LTESATLSHEERHARIRACVAAGRHNPEHLRLCEVFPDQEVRYCERCWSVIDPHGLTWVWLPKNVSDRRHV